MTLRIKTTPILFSISLFSVLSLAHADIYRYIDASGVMHFTNVPTSSKYRIYIKEKPRVDKPITTPDEYNSYILEASRRHGISIPLLKAIIKTESDFNPNAVSKKGAKGLMQIMPQTQQQLDLSNPFDPEENIMGGSRYLRQLLDRFQGSLKLALAAYNAGPSVVDRFQDIPPFRETEQYVEKVMKYYYLFKKG